MEVGEGEGEGASSHRHMAFMFVGEQEGTWMHAIAMKWKKTRGRVCCCHHVIA